MRGAGPLQIPVGPPRSQETGKTKQLVVAFLLYCHQGASWGYSIRLSLGLAEILQILRQALGRCCSLRDWSLGPWCTQSQMWPRCA